MRQVADGRIDGGALAVGMVVGLSPLTLPGVLLLIGNVPAAITRVVALIMALGIPFGAILAVKFANVESKEWRLLHAPISVVLNLFVLATLTVYLSIAGGPL